MRGVSSTLLDETLPAISKLEHAAFEVILLPNHIDKKQREQLSKYPWIRIYETPRVTNPAKKRDLGARYAKGEYLAFLDDDAYPRPDWLEKSLAHLQNPTIDAVCGPAITPATATRWELVFNDLLTSRFGSGKLQYRFCSMDARFVRDFPSVNFIIRTSRFEQVGGFGTFYWPGEDSKLCNAVTYNNPQAILYTPEVLVYHHRRSSPWAFLHQHGQYGYHRGLFVAHGDLNSRELVYVIPTMFLTYLLALAPLVYLCIRLNVSPGFIMILIAPFVAYLGMISYLVVRSIRRRKGVLFSLSLGFVAITMHLMYGFMFIIGIVDGALYGKGRPNR